MTIIYAIVSLFILVVLFFVAYLVRGPRFAAAMSILAFLTLILLYFVLVMFATSQM